MSGFYLINTENKFLTKEVMLLAWILGSELGQKLGRWIWSLKRLMANRGDHVSGLETVTMNLNKARFRKYFFLKSKGLDDLYENERKIQ